MPILVGLTNAQFHDWTDPWVGGLIALGLIIGVVFLFVERRAAEPIVPLDLFKIRTYWISILATFLASFGFFGAIIFLPRWYQIVAGSSATESGYQLLPLLAGLILASIVSGQYVSRTGHYKWLTVIALFTLTGGLYLMTNLRADTPRPALYVWQFIAGLGIGPTLAVFTIIVQNAVPWQKLGVATSNLTFFRQVGGTVGLAIAGTVFARTLETQAPIQVANSLTAAGVTPDQLSAVPAGPDGSTAFNLDQVTSVGDMGAAILASFPPEVQQFVAPYIPAIVAGHTPGVLAGHRRHDVDQHDRHRHCRGRRAWPQGATAAALGGRQQHGCAAKPDADALPAGASAATKTDVPKPDPPRHRITPRRGRPRPASAPSRGRAAGTSEASGAPRPRPRILLRALAPHLACP